MMYVNTYIYNYIYKQTSHWTFYDFLSAFCLSQLGITLDLVFLEVLVSPGTRAMRPDSHVGSFSHVVGDVNV